MKIKYYSNGFIVKEIDVDTYGKYRGVDGTWWPLEGKYAINIGTYDDDNYVDVCTSFDDAIEYARFLKAENKYVDILYCCTTRKYPKSLNDPSVINNFCFIGYDYAYEYGSYYSCIINDIGRIEELNHYETNEYGLIDNEDILLKFIKERNTLAKNSSNPMRFESGGFIIYKLWRYVGKL